VPSPSTRPQHLHLGDLRIETSFQASALRIDWSGRSNHLDPGAVLNPFLTEASRRASDAAAPVHMHFEGLEFFNSSTISVIIQYVKDLRAAKVRLEVFYNPHHQWQKIFFDALSMFEKGDGLLKMRPVA
jgi:hypothetical protein